MKFDFESLSTEPLFYMLMHSGAFVCVLGAIFFIIGLLFGYATWGRYKHQTRELRGQVDAMKDEIAGLKRKVGEQAVKPGPAIAIATETIHMPRKEGATAAEAVPAATQETVTTKDSRTQPAPPPPANLIKAKAPAPVEPSAAAPEADKTPEPPQSAEPPASEAARHASPLAAIIATPHVKEEPVAESDTSAGVASAPADTLPAVIELPMTPLPAVDVQPEYDPKLGLIYKAQPQRIDDLTALQGIAQGLAQRLHEFGIYTYAQIAAWNEDHIKEFSARLAFKDRIQREHWVEQAQQLVAKAAAV